MGRTNENVKVSFERPDGIGKEVKEMEVELFTWEKLDRVEDVKAAFGI
jgi:S-adenosylmethionine synthetase